MMTKERVREWAIYKKLLVDAANDKLKSKSIIIFFKLQLPTKFSFSNSDQKEKKYFYFCERFFRTYSSVTRCWSKKQPNFSKSCPKCSQCSFYIRVTIFEIAQNVANHFGLFCFKFCCQELSKIAQSGHTAYYPRRQTDGVLLFLLRYDNELPAPCWRQRQASHYKNSAATFLGLNLQKKYDNVLKNLSTFEREASVVFYNLSLGR